MLFGPVWPIGFSASWWNSHGEPSAIHYPCFSGKSELDRAIVGDHLDLIRRPERWAALHGWQQVKLYHVEDELIEEHDSTLLTHSHR
jgi:hypothetical protein